MNGQTLVGECLVFRSGTTIVSVWMDADTASRGKQSHHLDILRIHKANEVFHYDVYTVLMEVAMITKTEEIEFETFALDHLDVRDITDDYFRKIRLTGNGAEGGELWTIELHPIVVLLMLVDECLQYIWCIVHGVFSVVA